MPCRSAARFAPCSTVWPPLQGLTHAEARIRYDAIMPVLAPPAPWCASGTSPDATPLYATDPRGTCR
jgi:hypothetical protein